MAYELDRRADGTAAMFSVRQTPWHREGTMLTDAPSLDEAMRVGGLDFEVEARPLFTRVHQYPDVPNIYRYRTAANTCATVRTDREAVLGIVSRRYQPLQNRDALGVLAKMSSWQLYMILSRRRRPPRIQAEPNRPTRPSSFDHRVSHHVSAATCSLTGGRSFSSARLLNRADHYKRITASTPEAQAISAELAHGGC